MRTGTSTSLAFRRSQAVSGVNLFLESLWHLCRICPLRACSVFHDVFCVSKSQTSLLFSLGHWTPHSKLSAFLVALQLRGMPFGSLHSRFECRGPHLGTPRSSSRGKGRDTQDSHNPCFAADPVAAGNLFIGAMPLFGRSRRMPKVPVRALHAEAILFKAPT